MKQVNFTRIEIENFLSIGNETVAIDFKTGLNIITGVNHDKNESRNGVGKCLDEATEIDVLIEDQMVLEKFKLFCKN
jgi:hypothetical protein